MTYADIAPTAGVAFTINHIAAVFIPVVFGLMDRFSNWLVKHFGRYFRPDGKEEDEGRDGPPATTPPTAPTSAATPAE